MINVLPLVLAVPVGTMVYRLLPAVACALSRKLSDIRSDVNYRRSAFSEWPRLDRWLPERWLRQAADRLQQAGFPDRRSRFIYLCLMFFAIPVSALLGIIAGVHGFLPPMPGLILISIANGWISRRISSRKKAFTLALYKIYRFLDLQLTAGLKVTDALKGLPEAVQDPIVQPILLRFAARYELTFDFDHSYSEIRDAFGGNDCELMATHLSQCLQTGEAGRSLQRMEDLLFARTYTLMQADSQKIRLQLLLAALLALLPGASLFMIPLLNQAVSAMQSVFG